MILYYALLIVMTMLGAVASLFLKKASGSGNILKLIKNINFYIGGFLYFASALVNIVVLKHLDYSIVLPLTSITYIWTMLLSYIILCEKITKRKIGGIVFIVIGAIFVSM